MESFLNSLLGNPHFKDRLLSQMPRLLAILRHPDCQAISQISIDRDLVEVNGGTCWSFRRRRFVPQPLDEAEIGRITPRAFTRYDPNEKADAKFFKEIMTNSLNEQDIQRLCQDFLQLFQCQEREHKQKVPCLIGPSNSGKTSLFMATNNIIDVTKVAKVTKQKEFNKAMINEETELINLDEASVSMMDVDDWKTITQGGWTAHDRKWKSAKGFVNRAPIFITCQKELDFGSQEDNEAMDNRLHKYFFQPLPQVNKTAAKWIRTHPMSCIVWASEISGDLADAEEDELEDEDDCFLNRGLSDSDKAAIFSLSLDEDPDHKSQCQNSEEALENPENVTQHADPESSSEDCDDEDEILTALIQAKNSVGGNFGKARMLQSLIEKTKEEKRKVKENLKRQESAMRARRCEHLKELGVDENLLETLPSDPEVATPTPLAENIQERRQRLQAAEAEAEEQRVKDIFESEWLKSKELEMAQVQKETVNCSVQSVKSAKEYLVSVKSDAIRLYHEKEKTPRELGVELRRKLCQSLGILNGNEVGLVTTLYEPLPIQETTTQISPKTKRPPPSSPSSSQQDGPAAKKTKTASILSFFGIRQ